MESCKSVRQPVTHYAIRRDRRKSPRLSVPGAAITIFANKVKQLLYVCITLFNHGESSVELQVKTKTSLQLFYLIAVWESDMSEI